MQSKISQQQKAAASHGDRDEEYAAHADTPQGRFLDACWQSWQESDSEEAMLALLHAQQEALQDFDLDTVLDYGDALLDWFYRTENHAPRAFAWAAEAYGWHAALNEWRMSHLYDRYPFIANPRLTAYPALAQWDEHWQQGFLARLAQVIHPLRRSKAEAEFAAFCRDTHPPADVRDLPPSLRALYDLRERRVFAHVLGFLPFLGILLFYNGLRFGDGEGTLPLWLFAGWIAYLLSAAAYETLKIAGVTLSARGVLITAGAWGAVFTLCALLADHAQEALLWLAINLAAIFMLYMAAVFWQRILARQWLGYFSQRKWWWHAFVGLVLLVFWQQAYESVQNNQRNETVFLALTGAAFAYATLCRTALPPDAPAIREHLVARRTFAAAFLAGAGRSACQCTGRHAALGDQSLYFHRHFQRLERRPLSPVALSCPAVCGACAVCRLYGRP